MKTNKIKKALKSILYIFGPLIFGFITSLLFSTQSYKTVNKPPFSPKPIIFPIIWSILYLLMGISIYLLKRENKLDAKTLKLFLTQLIINYIWPFLFFSLKLYLLSSIWIMLLLYFVFLMNKRFYKIKKVSALLQIPYTIWLFIALYLNIGVTILN